jgi:hypothetical protein
MLSGSVVDMEIVTDTQTPGLNESKSDKVVVNGNTSDDLCTTIETKHYLS